MLGPGGERRRRVRGLLHRSVRGCARIRPSSSARCGCRSCLAAPAAASSRSHAGTRARPRWRRRLRSRSIRGASRRRGSRVAGWRASRRGRGWPSSCLRGQRSDRRGVRRGCARRGRRAGRPSTRTRTGASSHASSFAVRWRPSRQQADGALAMEAIVASSCRSTANLSCVEVEPRRAALGLPPRGSRAHRDTRRLRARSVRRLHRSPRRPDGSLVPRSSRSRRPVRRSRRSRE